MLVAAVANLGRTVRQTGARAFGQTAFLGAACRSALHYPPGARILGARTAVRQVYFTAVQALFLVGTLALAIGVIVIVQVHARTVKLGFSELFADVLGTVVIREIAPVLTAIIVIVRSGSAIAAEMATNTMVGETEALEAAGVDPFQYYVIPRVLAGAASVTLLTVYFDAVAVAGGLLVVWGWSDVSLAEYAGSLRGVLHPLDVWFTVARSAVFGAGIALLCSAEGLLGGRRPTDLPVSVLRGVVSSLLFVFAAAAVMSWLFYQWN